MSDAPRSAMFVVVWTVVALLAILHQDLWYWDNRTLVMGFMPIGLFYHATFSLVCAAVWTLAIRYAWPSHIEAWADEHDERSDAEDGS